MIKCRFEPCKNNVPFEIEMGHGEFCNKKCYMEYIEMYVAQQELMPGMPYEDVKELREMFDAYDKRHGIK